MLTTEALRRIVELYVIEAEIRGKPPDERRQVRQARARPLVDDPERWLRDTLRTLSRKSDTAAAILYALKLWPALLRYCDDGAIEIDNSAAELPCAVWRLAVATTCSLAPIAVATAPPLSTP